MALLREYTALLRTLRERGYALKRICDYFDLPDCPCVFLRHDVDRFPSRSVELAELEFELGVRATYYFRASRRGMFARKSIERIHEMGHEIGFHYESFARTNGDCESAIALFKKELAALRQICEVSTISAHGGPLSRWSNMDFGKVYLRLLSDLKILGDAREDLDFSEMLYISDTGGRFGSRHNLRDRVEGINLETPFSPIELSEYLSPASHGFVVINTHPERWVASSLAEVQVSVTDTVINTAKSFVRIRKGKGN